MELSFKNNFNNSKTAYCRTYLKTISTTNPQLHNKTNSKLILKQLQYRYPHINGKPPPIKRGEEIGGGPFRKWGYHLFSN